MEKAIKENKVFKYTIFALIMLCILLIRSCISNNELSESYDSKEHELVITKNKLGQERATNALFVAKDKKDFIKMKTDNETIKHLQDLVKSYKGKLYSATVLINETKVNGSGKTKVITNITKNGDSLPCPEQSYSTSYSDEWQDLDIFANKDSISWGISIRNRYDINIGESSNGWFKKRTSEVSIFNLNPNTETKELFSYSVPHEQKKFTVGLTVAPIGVGLTDFKPQPFIGLGINWTIFSIK